ncbi:MAG: hypothetical protein K8I27_09305 [Planctomycetes bacterium]|nr:hypothetical protein [Planctomycetota bacterium]
MRVVLAALLLIAAPAFAANLTVNVSGNTPPDFSNQLSDTGVEVARFVFQATGGDVDISAVTLHVSNHLLADEAFTNVRVFFDSEPNQTFSPGEQVDTDKTPDGVTDALTFAGSFTVLNGNIHTLLVLVDIANNATVYGQAYDWTMDPQSDVTLANVPPDVITNSNIGVSNSITLRHSENQLVPGTGNPGAPRETSFGASNVAALHFAIDSLNAIGPGQLSGIDLASITISITCATSIQTALPTRLRLWTDDGDSSFEPGSGEIMIQERVPADLTKWIIAGTVISATFDGTAIQNLQDIAAGTVRTFWVSIDFGSGPETTCEVSLTRTNVLGALGTAADYFVTNPTAISGDVLTVTDPPKKKPSKSPEGEGGCSTGTHTSYLLILLALTGLARIAMASACKRGAVKST